jgi:RNA polymerase sigma-70 factor, ECF subfamily
MSDFTSRLQAEIPRLRRYARALARDPVRADDLVQNCLLRALANEGQWQPASHLRAWMFTILHNEYVSDLRRVTRDRRGCSAVACASSARCEPKLIFDLLDLDRAIAKLPDPQRRVLLLIGLEGMSYEQAAAVLGLPIGTVHAVCHRNGRTTAGPSAQAGRPAQALPL